MRKLGLKPMWFRTVDMPLSKPKFFNYTAQREPQSFEKFSDSDSKRLEEAYTANKSRVRVMHDGLYTVDLKNKCIEPTYWDGPKFRVLRGTWFRQMNMHPAPQPLAEKLEKLWTEIASNGELPDHQESRDDISFKIKDGIVTATIQDNSILDRLKSLGTTTQSYVRGYHPSAAMIELPSVLRKNPPQLKERDIRHLIFCIHGIGQKLSLRFDFVSFVKDTNTFRQALETAFLDSKDAQDAAGSPDNSRVQVLPILWRQEWEHRAGNSNPKLKNVTPETVFFRDNVLADAVLDFLAYQDNNIRTEIDQITINLLNSKYKQFCEDHPGFAANPKVSIIAHSLGSVMANNILRTNKLDFKVDNLFALGSPLGILDLLTGTPFTKDGLNAESVYNILRPSDPIASRLEPLVCGEISKKVVPMPIGRRDDSIINQIVDSINSAVGYTNKLASNVNTVWESVTAALLNDKTRPSEVKLEPVSDVNVEKMQKDLSSFNRHARLDFAIPENIEINLAIGLAGHLTYLESSEVASFVLKEIYKIGDTRTGIVLQKSGEDASTKS